MSPVFRHGRLRLYLLKLLDEAPRHGYEVIRLLQDRFMGVYAPSPGTIYPRLARLEEEGLVTHDEADGKKVYRITDKGRAELHARLDDLTELEEEITASVRDIAREVTEDVRETVRSLREEITWAAREFHTRARQSAHGADWGNEERDREDAESDRREERNDSERDRQHEREDEPLGQQRSREDGRRGREDERRGREDERRGREEARRSRDEARRAREEAREARGRAKYGRGDDPHGRHGGHDWGDWARGDWASWASWGGWGASGPHGHANPHAYRDLERLARQFSRELHSAAWQAQAISEDAVRDLRGILDETIDRIKAEVFGGKTPPRQPGDPGGADTPPGGRTDRS